MAEILKVARARPSAQAAQHQGRARQVDGREARPPRGRRGRGGASCRVAPPRGVRRRDGTRGRPASPAAAAGPAMPVTAMAIRRGALPRAVGHRAATASLTAPARAISGRTPSSSPWPRSSRSRSRARTRRGAGDTVRRAAIRPPVQDSAVAKVKPGRGGRRRAARRRCAQSPIEARSRSTGGHRSAISHRRRERPQRRRHVIEHRSEPAMELPVAPSRRGRA